MGEITRTDPDVGADIRELRRSIPSLEAVERRRAQLWTIAGVVMLGSGVALAVVLTDPEATSVLPSNLGIRLGVIGVTVAFLLHVFDQERRLRTLSRALVQEKVLSQALESRVQDLATLSKVGHVVNSVLNLDEVLGVVLDGAFELTGSRSGSVMLLDGSELVVAASQGSNPAPLGIRQPLDAGVAGWVASHREPILINGRLSRDQLPNLRDRGRGEGSSVVAPLVLADELVGVLTLERAPTAPAFTDWELRAVSLFAAHAATAVAHARRYDEQRGTVDRLAETLERRSEHVASLVHDLKSPLTAIIGYVRLLRVRGGELDQTRHDQVLGRAEDATSQLLEMVNRILSQASDEVQTDLRREPLDLPGLLNELADLTASMAWTRDGTEREVVVDLAIDDPTVWTHPGALRSVLANLLENAVKYSPIGAPVEVSALRVEDEMWIRVRDHGPGLGEGQREIVFERFRQDGGDAGGVGLGLYIVRSLVGGLGGRVWIDDAPGGGSLFTVALPMSMPVSPPPVSQAARN